VRQPRGDAHQDGKPVLFGKVQHIPHQVIGFLLIPRLKERNTGKIRVAAGILLVLTGIQEGSSATITNQSALGSGHGGIHKRIRRHIQAHMLHADDNAPTGVRHAQRFFHRRLFVGTPFAVHLRAAASEEC
jgi:hypothetical protein